MKCPHALPAVLIALAFSVHAEEPSLEARDFGEVGVKGKIPQGWHVTQDEEEGVTVFQVTREDPVEGGEFLAGFTLSVTPDVPGRAGMKPSQYAGDLLSFAVEDGGKVVEEDRAPFKTFRAEYRIDGHAGEVDIVDYAVANDGTGTLYFVVWQSPVDDSGSFGPVRKAILDSLEFDPAR